MLVDLDVLGTFLPPIFHDLGRKAKPVALVVGLFNFDLFPDIATADGAHANTVSVLLGMYGRKRTSHVEKENFLD